MSVIWTHCFDFFANKNSLFFGYKEFVNANVQLLIPKLTWMFHVRGRGMVFWPFCKWVDVRLAFGFVCCIIWLMRSSCCRDSPSLAAAAGKLGDDDLEPSPLTPLPLNCKQFEPCGELASPKQNKTKPKFKWMFQELKEKCKTRTRIDMENKKSHDSKFRDNFSATSIHLN